MNCKHCNTRMPAGGNHCPHCGWVDPGASFSGQRTAPPPPAKPQLSPSTAILDDELGEEEVVDLELDDEAAAEAPATAAPKRAPSPAALSRSNRSPRKAAPAPASAPGPAPQLRVGPAELRALLADEPELLEPGLAVYADDSGQAVGVGFGTDVGTIDLLARDREGALVVVTVATPDADEALIAEVLQRIGWVRKHVGKGSQGVRAIVLLEPGRDDLSYAAAAVADTVRFKTWRFALSFADVEV